MAKTAMRRRREALGLTITELARRLGIPYSTIQAVDGGRGRGFDPKMKVRLAEALGAAPLDLFPELDGQVDYESGRGWILTGR